MRQNRKNTNCRLTDGVGKRMFMEWNEKLSELRKQKGLTQEELAEALYVSRAAVSKWESGRGYPNIDSLKAVAKYFGITIDELLSGEELLTLAEEDSKEKESHVRDLVWGLLDCSVAMVWFLPFFGLKSAAGVQEVSLGGLCSLAPYLRVSYYGVVIGIILCGVVTLALQNCSARLWLRNKAKLSLGWSILGTLLFIVSSQPYAAAFFFVFLIIKVLMPVKWK